MRLTSRDLWALRHAIAAERSGAPMSPHELATELGITTAGATKLVQRLEAAGHLDRDLHPGDRRSVRLRPTAHAHAEVRDWLGSLHAELIEVARRVPAASRSDVLDFLRGITGALDDAARAAARRDDAHDAPHDRDAR